MHETREVSVLDRDAIMVDAWEPMMLMGRQAAYLPATIAHALHQDAGIDLLPPPDCTEIDHE